MRKRFGGCFGALLLLASCEDDPAPRDVASVRDGGSPADAGQHGDAGAESGAECKDRGDCVNAPPGFGCVQCQEGSEACPEVDCVNGACVIRVPELCRELERVFACTEDGDCERHRASCAHVCEDGTAACVATACTEGVCVPTFHTCGLVEHACPEGSRGYFVCTACGPAGGCGELTLRCSEECTDDGDCSDDSTACAEAIGVCIPELTSGCI